MNPENW